MKSTTGLRTAAAAGAVVVLAATAASPASAQPAPRSVSVRAGLRSLYDSNVARGSDEVARTRRLRKDDITYSPTLNADISTPVGRQTVYLRGSVGYEAHQYNTQLDSERIALSTGVKGEVGPCGGTLSGQFSRGQSDLADLALSVTKNVQQNTTLSADATCSSRSGLGIVFGGSDSHLNNTANDRVVNSHQQSVFGGISHTSDALGTVSLRANYSKLDNDTPSIVTGLPLKGFENSGFGVNISRPIGARLTGTASLSYSKVSSSGANSGYSGVAGSGELQYIVGPRLQMTLGYERNAAPGLQSGFNYAMFSAVRFGANYVLSPKIQTNLALRYTDRSFRGQVGAPTIDQITNDNTFSVTGGANLRLGRRMSLGLTGGWENRKTNLPRFDYSAYRIGLTATSILIGN